MGTELSPHAALPADSFLEYAFLRWVLAPATAAEIVDLVIPQREVEVDGRWYRLDYEIAGAEQLVAVELDGFEFHSSRYAFSYDRLRQNDIQATGRVVIRFSYDSIRRDTRRCVDQLQAVLQMDPLLAGFVLPDPVIEPPEMDPDPLYALRPAPHGEHQMSANYFDTIRDKLNQRTLRDCQTQAFAALANYYGGGGKRAACVMSVGAGKTALGVAASLAFTKRRAMVITPGSVIRGTFETAFDHEAVDNVLYGLPGGPLIPGCAPPRTRTLDRTQAPIRDVTREELLASDVIVTNFHSLGTGEDEDDLLSKLAPEDIDFIVVDEAHIAAAESYQRAFEHFTEAQTLLMSACFQRLDGRPIDADVVYRYRLIDSIVDGNAKNLRVQRFSPEVAQTTYEMVWPDGSREEIVGRDALMELLGDERKLARITAKSTEPIRQVMRTVKQALDRQTELLYPVKPRVLFAALGGFGETICFTKVSDLRVVCEGDRVAQDGLPQPPAGGASPTETESEGGDEPPLDRSSKGGNTPLWEQLGEVLDDPAQVVRRLVDAKATKTMRQLADAYCQGWCSLHVHFRLGAVAGESQPHDFCLSCQSLSTRDGRFVLDRAWTASDEVDVGPSARQQGGYVQGAVLVNDVEQLNKPKEFRPIALPSLVRLVSLHECPGPTADVPANFRFLEGGAAVAQRKCDFTSSLHRALDADALDSLSPSEMVERGAKVVSDLAVDDRKLRRWRVGEVEVDTAEIARLVQVCLYPRGIGARIQERSPFTFQPIEQFVGPIDLCMAAI